MKKQTGKSIVDKVSQYTKADSRRFLNDVSELESGLVIGYDISDRGYNVYFSKAMWGVKKDSPVSVEYHFPPGLEEHGVGVVDCSGFARRPQTKDDALHLALNHVLEKKDGEEGISRYSPESLLYTLVRSNVCEGDAQAIIAFFEGEILGGRPSDIKGKNSVYEINVTDRFGKKQVIKFVRDREEARIESLVNYHFSRDPVLRNFVPGSSLEKPIELNVGDESFYLTIQEEVNGRADARLDNLLRSGSKRDRDAYLSYSMKVLANMHVRGTAIMNQLAKYSLDGEVRELAGKKAQNLVREKDYDRREVLGIKLDNGFISNLAESGIQDRDWFIHADLKYENKIGQFYIDWGISGKGNPYLDLARVFVDNTVQRASPLIEDEITYFISGYLRERNRIMGLPAPSHDEVEKGYVEYQQMEYLLASSLGPYLMVKDKPTPNEAMSGKIMLERAYRTHNQVFDLAA